MVLTAEPILQGVSSDLRELTTDTGTRRVAFFNKAVKHVLGKFKWTWSRKTDALTTTVAVQTYDLTTELDDYSPLRGVFKVYQDGEEITAFEMSDDGKSITFVNTIDGAEDIDICYYAEHLDITLHTATLNIPLPEEIGSLVGAYILFLEHRSKKQRNDARNAMIDFTDMLDDLRPQDASNKASAAKKRIQPVMQYMRFKRTYSN